MHITNKIIISILMLFLSQSFVFADENTIDDLIKIVKKGDYQEKLSAAKQLEMLGSQVKGKEKELSNQFKNIESPELAVQILSTLISMEADDKGVYKTFSNYLKYKENKREEKLKAESYLREISNINKISPSLIEFVKSYRDDKKRDQILLYEVLASLLEREPKYIDQIVSEISTNPEESIRTLTELKGGVAQYLPQVMAKINEKPIAVMDFVRKHGDLNNSVLIEYAIKRAKETPATKRLGLSIIYLGPYYYHYEWLDAIEALTEMSKNNDSARETLIELLSTDWWYIILEAIVRNDDNDPKLAASVKEHLLKRLPEIVTKDIELSTIKYNPVNDHVTTQPYIFNGYRACYTLSKLGLKGEEELNIIKNTIVNSPSEFTVGGCLLALMNWDGDSRSNIQFLENYLTIDWEKEFKESKDYMGRPKLANNFRYDILQMRQDFNTSVIPYNAAAVIMSIDPTNQKATDVIHKYLDESIPLIKQIHYRFLKRMSYQSYYYDKEGFYAYQVEFSPIEILSNKYDVGGTEWNMLVLEALSSENEYQNLNAAHLLLDKKPPLISMEIKTKLLEKISEKPTDPKIAVYIEVLREHFPNDEDIKKLVYTRYSHYWNLLYRNIL
ncbi:MAG: hypothetical protein R3D86_11545 [Emcibacteraceae bacterium]